MMAASRETLLKAIQHYEESRYPTERKQKPAPVHDWLKDHTIGADEFSIINLAKIIVHIADCEAM